MKEFVKDFGLSADGGVTLEPLVAFFGPALGHRVNAVREAAVLLYVELYKLAGPLLDPLVFGGDAAAPAGGGGMEAR